MEAMALEVPVIATRIAGIPELVVDQENGLLFSPANWEELAGRLFQLSNDAELRRRLGSAGREKVSKSHNVETAFEPLIDYFEQQKSEGAAT